MSRAHEPASTPEALLRLTRRALEHAVAGEVAYEADEATTIPAHHYYDERRLAREREVFFRRSPVIVGHASELAPGSVRSVDVAGQPLLIARDDDGVIRAFLNVCRHRGMRVVHEPEVCRRTGLVCPYHGWSYGLDGRLRGLLHRDAFPGLDLGAHGLVEVPSAVRHDLIWARPAPGPAIDGAALLGALDDELGWLLGESALYRRVDVVRRANWKLIIDAFLDGYHLRVLHKGSIYPFFLDGVALSEPVGPHLRSLAARRRLKEAAGVDEATWAIRELVTFTHYLFPNAVLIHHPDYVSVITVSPVDADHLRWVHQMLIPADQHTEARRAHWERTFALIEETVFQREDLFAAEGIQAGLRAGANASLLLGRLERPIVRTRAPRARAPRPRGRPGSPCARSPPAPGSRDPAPGWSGSGG